jgi:hypothetical protein
MSITSRKGMNQSKHVVFILEIDLASSHFSWSLSQVCDDADTFDENVDTESRREVERRRRRGRRDDWTRVASSERQNFFSILIFFNY